MNPPFGEDHLHLRDRMRPGDAGELWPARLASELRDQAVVHFGRLRLGDVVKVDMHVIAVQIIGYLTDFRSLPFCRQRPFCYKAKHHLGSLTMAGPMVVAMMSAGIVNLSRAAALASNFLSLESLC